MMSQEQLARFWDDDKIRLYKKTGTVEARLAKDGEKIETIIDGQVETTNTAHSGDVVVVGAKKEQYIVTSKTFADRYKGPKLSSDLQTYQPTGYAYAMEWTEKGTAFTASWGEKMVILPGDYLACTKITDSGAPDGGLYRIERGAFHKTYMKVDERTRTNSLPKS